MRIECELVTRIECGAFLLGAGAPNIDRTDTPRPASVLLNAHCCPAELAGHVTEGRSALQQAIDHMRHAMTIQSPTHPEHDDEHVDPPRDVDADESGDQPSDDSVEQMFRSLGPVARGMVARTRRGDLEAESILNRVMVRWLPQRNRWLGRSGEARRFLITCLRNEIATALRKARPAHLAEDPAQADRPEPPDNDDRLVREAIESTDLPEELRRVAIIRCVDGASWERVGEAIGAPADTLKMMWSRKRTLFVRGLLSLAAGDLGALNHVIARRIFVEDEDVALIAESLGLDPQELADRIECEIVPTLRIRFGSFGLEVLRRASRRDGSRG